MRKPVVLALFFVALALAGVVVYNRGADPSGSGGSGSGGGRGGFTGARPPMPVEFADVKRTAVTEQIVVVGNARGHGGSYRVGHSVMKDALDQDGIWNAIRDAGLELPD